MTTRTSAWLRSVVLLLIILLAAVLASCSSSSNGVNNESLRIYEMIAGKGGFVAVSGDTTGNRFQLTLTGVPADVLYFTDRPAQEAGYDTVANVINNIWPRVYGSVAPNVLLQATVANQGAIDLFCMLENPAYNAATGQLSFTLTYLNGNQKPVTNLNITDVKMIILNNAASAQVEEWSQLMEGGVGIFSAPAADGTVSITLQQPYGTVFSYTNAPGRKSAIIALKDYLQTWQTRFGSVQPNISFAYNLQSGQTAGVQIVSVTKTPVYDEKAGTITFTAKILYGTTPVGANGLTVTAPSLFVDGDDDPTEGWSKSARYGDFLSAQMKSLKKFGYGIYIAKMQAAYGPVCSTFWLYSDAPAPGAMPEISQLWRWNEFDFEFVPYTQAPQNSYITLDGSFPAPNVNYYGSTLDWANMPNGQITPDIVKWVPGLYMTDDVVFADMQKFYNTWMVPNDSKYKVAVTDYNFNGAVNTTGSPHSIGSTTNPGWATANQWKYPLTAVKPFPDVLDIKQSATINWWRTPTGNQSIDVSLPGYEKQTFSHIVYDNVIPGSTAKSSSKPATLSSETFIFPQNKIYNPYTVLNTYTIVWTKTRIAYYINAGSDGKDIAGSTPVAVFTTKDYPSIAASGTQAQQGTIPWADTSFSDQLGMVSINLANYVAFAEATASNNADKGWSGYPPGPAWKGADAYIRSVEYYPLTSGDPDGTQNSHFDYNSAEKWVFNLGDGNWKPENFNQKLASYFGILYSQSFTKEGTAPTNLRDAKSPLAVSFVSNEDGALAADKKPLMKLTSRPSDANPVRNFFRLGTTMDTGKAISSTNPYMYATIDTDGTGKAVIGVSGASTPLSFFGPAKGTNVDVTVNLYTNPEYIGGALLPPTPGSKTKMYTAVINLKTDNSTGKSTWSFKSGDSIITAFQPVNPHLITVKLPTQ